MNRLNILVVEDNEELREVTVEVLRRDGHLVQGVESAERVAEHVGKIDLMLIDINLPGENGFALTQRVRAVQPAVGIIMLTARASPNDKQLGYRSGADIYMAKPINNEELCAAVASLGRRLSPTSMASSLLLQSAMLSLQGPTQRVVLGTQDVAMLVAFMRASEQRLENWELIELLNKSDAQDPKAALELQIVRLRKKLQQAGAESPTIQSIRGWGYQLCVSLTLVV
jgi:DNA-binding response OmpR family regulator